MMTARVFPRPLRALCTVTTMTRRLLVISAVLLILPASAHASTDEQRLAAHLHSALASFPSPNCPARTVHLHADAALRTAYPSDPEVRGMGTDSGAAWAEPCSVWLRSGMSSSLFRYTLFHEMAHTAGWTHSPAMDTAVVTALNRTRPHGTARQSTSQPSSPSQQRSHSRSRRAWMQRRNRTQRQIQDHLRRQRTRS